GVEISVKPQPVDDDEEQLGYSPSRVPGRPGQIMLVENSSIAAVEHEYHHFINDRNTGYLGFNELVFGNPVRRWEWEKEAYALEMGIYQELGYGSLIPRLEVLLDEERRRLERLFGIELQ
ncbi:MAG: hypothetical protein IJH87_05395, partial [Atopobiaceae bacterium]|nr:hypothetical protein [Atopobiaceae bacterium]